jgi:hypothetical protein
MTKRHMSALKSQKENAVFPKSISACLILSCACLFPFQSSCQETQCQEHAILHVFERIQFLTMSEGARPEVSAQYLSEPGCGRQMLAALGKLSAKVDYADEKSGYALVTIAREKLLDTLDIAGIEYAFTRHEDRVYYHDPDANIPQSERRPEPVPKIEIPYPTVAKTLPPDGPFYDASAIGLTELWKQHPEADGRGVRVAVLDDGFDLLHPALQQARDAAGNIVPKVADLGGMTAFDQDPGWVQLGEPVTTRGGTFEAAGRTWTVPEDGVYRFGIFRSVLVLGPEDNTHTKKLLLSVGVLWNPQTMQVWLDTDGDGNFRNQRALRDYGVTHDIDWFGVKEGNEDNRIPFGVKIDSGRTAIYLRVGGNGSIGHGALVAGPLAANTLTGGLFNGAAPSAQLVDQNVGRATLVAAMVAMSARPDVDVVNRSGGIARAGYTGLQEGIEDFAQRVLERTISVYGKPMACFCDAAGTIFVDDFAGAEMLRRNRQLPPPYLDTINGGILGRPDGLVNTVLAPSANLETESRYHPLDIPWPDGRKHSFDDKDFDPPAPDGYVIGDNNSPTIPVVSGVLADLISEARREHVRYNALRLNNAIFTGARLLNGFPVSQQGYGLINAEKSWNQLTRMAKADDPANPDLTSFTFARVASDRTVEVQGFRADLAKAGEKVDGEIWITRHGGYAGGRKYALSLRGDDASFELIDHEVTLVRDKAVRMRFRSNGAPGLNVALLELRDAEANVVMQDLPLSVRAPDVPQQIAPGVDRFESDIPPLRSEHRYVRVGEDVQAARYVIRAPYVGPDSILSAPGIRSRDVVPPGEPVDAAHHVGPMETLESLVANDSPGTQDIFWENRGRPEYRTQYDPPAPDVPIHAELTVTKYAVQITHDADNLTLTNEQAAIDGRAELFDATLKTQSLTGTGLHAMGEVERTLPDHLAEWRLEVKPSGPLEGPADVYVFNCTGKNGCYVAAQQEISEAGRTLVIEGPQSGAWKIAVRSRKQVKSPMTYTIREAMLVPTPTPLDAADSTHPYGASWTLPLPKSRSDAQYAAFRISGTPGIASEKNGLVIAMTLLETDAP